MKSPRSILHTNVTKQMLLCSAFCCAAVLQAMGQFPSLSPLPSTGSLQPASDPHKFTFLVAGDNRPCKSSDPQSSTPQTIFAAAVKLNPTFVLWTGDSIYGKDKCDGPSSDPCHSSTIDKEYQAFFVIAKKAGVPVFNAPGNHEMDNKEDVPNPTMQALYAKYAAQPYGSFDYGDSHFIALNTEEVAPSGTTKSARAVVDSSTSSTTLDPGYVSKKQLKELDEDLKANGDKKHIFVFMHHPIEPYKKDDGLDKKSAEALKAIFAKYDNISYVLSGHEHMYFNPQGKKGTDPPPDRTDPSKDPPYYIVTGGGGAPLSGTSTCGSTDSKVPGAFYHYLVFEVDHDKVKAKLKKLD
ncbi:MAG: metallophosphoesterase family protein [Terriglobia bacterium]